MHAASSGSSGSTHCAHTSASIGERGTAAFNGTNTEFNSDRTTGQDGHRAPLGSALPVQGRPQAAAAHCSLGRGAADWHHTRRWPVVCRGPSPSAGQRRPTLPQRPQTGDAASRLADLQSGEEAGWDLWWDGVRDLAGASRALA